MGNETPVAATLDRLMHEGLDRHDAIHAIGSVLAGLMWEMSRSDDDPQSEPKRVVLQRASRSKPTAQGWIEEYSEQND